MTSPSDEPDAQRPSGEESLEEQGAPAWFCSYAKEEKKARRRLARRISKLEEFAVASGAASGKTAGSKWGGLAGALVSLAIALSQSQCAVELVSGAITSETGGTGNHGLQSNQ